MLQYVQIYFFSSSKSSKREQKNKSSSVAKKVWSNQPVIKTKVALGFSKCDQTSKMFSVQPRCEYCLLSSLWDVITFIGKDTTAHLTTSSAMAVAVIRQALGKAY